MQYKYLYANILINRHQQLYYKNIENYILSKKS